MFPETHFVVAKQVTNLTPHVAVLRQALVDTRRAAPVDLLNLPPDAARFLRPDGTITVNMGDVERIRLGEPAPILEQRHERV
jgi:hypothetical protein